MLRDELINLYNNIDRINVKNELGRILKRNDIIECKHEMSQKENTECPVCGTKKYPCPSCKTLGYRGMQELCPDCWFKAIGDSPIGGSG